MSARRRPGDCAESAAYLGAIARHKRLGVEHVAVPLVLHSLHTATPDACLDRLQHSHAHLRHWITIHLQADSIRVRIGGGVGGVEPP